MLLLAIATLSTSCYNFQLDGTSFHDGVYFMDPSTRGTSCTYHFVDSNYALVQLSNFDRPKTHVLERGSYVVVRDTLLATPAVQFLCSRLAALQPRKSSSNHDISSKTASACSDHEYDAYVHVSRDTLDPEQLQLLDFTTRRFILTNEKTGVYFSTVNQPVFRYRQHSSGLKHGGRHRLSHRAFCPRCR